ncbi:Acyl-CoA dehydrogenase family member 11 [Yarrowia sp. B02]|nr:Acyl-CoA dehydrogenase family member 11 [Yarrowia sp. B02]
MATATTGFFQDRPTLLNQFEGNPALKKVAEFYLSEKTLAAVTPELKELGDSVISKEQFEWQEDAETNIPRVEHQGTFGHPKNRLIVSQGWKLLKARAFATGIISDSYERKYAEESRVVAFLKNWLFSASSATVLCPFAMTDGTARVLEVFAKDDERLQEWYKHLISPDPKYAWTSGQWMTERPGGSDVRNTETVATSSYRKEDGAENRPSAAQIENNATSDIVTVGTGPRDYTVNGFKWFSSATDSECSILLAKREGEAGLSCFIGKLTPETVIINRLKKKFGTVALPTAELELRNHPVILLGQANNGVPVIATVLNITRLYSSTSALSCYGRALHIAKQYALVRSVFGKKLSNTPAHLKTLAHEEVQLTGLMFLLFEGVALLGQSEVTGLAPHREAVLRVLPGIAKAYCCKKATIGCSECMEALGGAGYLEHEIDINIARLYRESQVNVIWEGTTNVLSDDVARVMKGKRGPMMIGAFEKYISEVSSDQSVLEEFAAWKKWVESMDLEATRADARNVTYKLAHVIVRALLLRNAAKTGDKVDIEIANRWKNADLSGDAVYDSQILYGDKTARL